MKLCDVLKMPTYRGRNIMPTAVAIDPSLFETAFGSILSLNSSHGIAVNTPTSDSWSIKIGIRILTLVKNLRRRQKYYLQSMHLYAPYMSRLPMLVE